MDHPQTVQHTMTDTTNNVTSPPSARSPLSNRSNANVHRTNSSIWDHKDSSEGRPSTHDSVYDAAWLSTSDVAKSPYQTPGRPLTPLRSVEIDIDSESPLSRLETPFLYGYGTELAPILETRSIATLRTKGSLSTSDLSSLLHDAPGASSSSKGHSEGDNTTSAAFQLRHQYSFEPGDDSQKQQLLQQKGEAVSSSPQLRWLSYSRPTVHIVDIHAYPRKPIYPPPQRALTPPSLRRVRRPQSEGDAYVSSSTGSTTGAVAYAAPGFKPLRSGHGNLSNHPFLSQARTQTQPQSQATRASTSSTQVRGTAQLRTATGLRRPERVPTPRHLPLQRSSLRSSTASPDLNYLAPPSARGRLCKRCRHPRGERWSLCSTLVGHGPGVRRGDDWCGRCAVRKVVRAWCCGELGH
ncbi:hypothetical protein F5Y08DRAFT_137124 [Xylaria arbuscula]|nr:hypothetical protein F5Y08DRAFT_137124 [Xylaria arbuscula]